MFYNLAELSKNMPKDYVSIPSLVIKHLPADKKVYDLVVFFYKLKGLKNCGTIKNYRKRYPYLSEKLQMGESTIRLKISKLKDLGLVRSDKKNLYIGSKYYLLQWLGYQYPDVYKDDIKEKKLHSIQLKKEFLYKDKKFLNEFLCYLKLYDNIEVRQKSAYIQKLQFVRSGYNALPKSKKGCCFREKFTKVVKGSREYVLFDNKSGREFLKDGVMQDHVTNIHNLKGRHTTFNKFKEDESLKRNENFTLSRRGVAKVLGRKSRSWGVGFINKMKSQTKLIKEDVVNDIEIGDYNMSVKDYVASGVRNKYQYGYIFKSKIRNKTYLKVANTIVLDTFEFTKYMNKGCHMIKSIF